MEDKMPYKMRSFRAMVEDIKKTMFENIKSNNWDKRYIYISFFGKKMYEWKFDILDADVKHNIIIDMKILVDEWNNYASRFLGGSDKMDDVIEEVILKAFRQVFDCLDLPLHKVLRYCRAASQAQNLPEPPAEIQMPDTPVTSQFHDMVALSELIKNLKGAEVTMTIKWNGG
jgi:hypothetical protein